MCNMKYNINHLLDAPHLFPLEIYSSPISAVNEPHVTVNISKLQGTTNGCLFLALWLNGWFLYWQTHQKQEMCVAMHGTALPLGLVVVVAEPQIYFTKGLWAHNPNLANKSRCSYLKNDIQIRSLFYTYQNSCVAMTYTNLWANWIIIDAKRTSTKFQLWGHKPFVKWNPCLASKVCYTHKILTRSSSGNRLRGLWLQIFIIYSRRSSFSNKLETSLKIVHNFLIVHELIKATFRDSYIFSFNYLLR